MKDELPKPKKAVFRYLDVNDGEISPMSLEIILQNIFDDLDSIITVLFGGLVSCDNCGAVFKDMKCAKRHEKLCVAMNPKRKR